MKQSLLNYINEAQFDTYHGYIRVTFSQDLGITNLADLIRALPGVTTVTPIEGNKQANQEIYKVKLITQRSGAEAFDKLKDTAVNQYPEVRKVEVAQQTIVKRN